MLVLHKPTYIDEGLQEMEYLLTVIKSKPYPVSFVFKRFTVWRFLWRQSFLRLWASFYISLRWSQAYLILLPQQFLTGAFKNWLWDQCKAGKKLFLKCILAFLLSFKLFHFHSVVTEVFRQSRPFLTVWRSHLSILVEPLEERLLLN